MTLPRETTDRVQEILNSNETPFRKAQLIHCYDDACLSRENDRRKPKPRHTVQQIHNELLERLR